MGNVSMDIDDTNIRDEQMPQTPNQPPSSAIDAELAELFGCDIRDIREPSFTSVRRRSC